MHRRTDMGPLDWVALIWVGIALDRGKRGRRTGLPFPLRGTAARHENCRKMPEDVLVMKEWEGGMILTFERVR